MSLASSLLAESVLLSDILGLRSLLWLRCRRLPSRRGCATFISRAISARPWC